MATAKDRLRRLDALQNVAVHVSVRRIQRHLSAACALYRCTEDELRDAMPESEIDGFWRQIFAAQDRLAEQFEGLD